MYTPIYYALEARSYAQTIFLVTLSSWVLWKLLSDLKESGDWSLRSRLIPISTIVLVNTALSLTHYYNFFWLIAQVMFVASFLLIELGRESWLKAITSLVGISLLAPLAFALIWGDVLYEQYLRRSVAFQAEASEIRNPLELLFSITSQNIALPTLIVFLLLALVVAASAWSITRAWTGRKTREGSKSWFLIYLLSWSILPVVVAYLVFVLLGVERVLLRYFVFVVPPISAIVVVSVFIFLQPFTRKFLGSSRVIQGAVSTLIVLSTFAPTGYEAAIFKKEDFRGNAENVARLIASDSANNYLVLEAENRPIAHYYFSKLDTGVRVSYTFKRSQERKENFDALKEFLAKAPEVQKLIVVFNHSKATDFPNLINFLSRSYSLVQSDIDNLDRGILIFAKSGD
jgi:hypothetical protein